MTHALQIHITPNIVKSKIGKAVPLQAWSGPEGSSKLRLPDYMTTAHDGGKVVSLTHRPPLSPGNAPGTHFCWRLSGPQGHSAIGRMMSMKNPNDTIWNRTSDLPILLITRQNTHYGRGGIHNYIYFTKLSAH
jgi:hypothetical protein